MRSSPPRAGLPEKVISCCIVPLNPADLPTAGKAGVAGHVPANLLLVLLRNGSLCFKTWPKIRIMYYIKKTACSQFYKSITRRFGSMEVVCYTILMDH